MAFWSYWQFFPNMFRHPHHFHSSDKPKSLEPKMMVFISASKWHASQVLSKHEILKFKMVVTSFDGHFRNLKRISSIGSWPIIQLNFFPKFLEPSVHPMVYFITLDGTPCILYILNKSKIYTWKKLHVLAFDLNVLNAKIFLIKCNQICISSRRLVG